MQLYVYINAYKYSQIIKKKGGEECEEYLETKIRFLIALKVLIRRQKPLQGMNGGHSDLPSLSPWSRNFSDARLSQLEDGEK